MRFKGLDLNLLVALDALLMERNVSAAARKLFMSQSAMSGALARLREHFQDELLVPQGKRMVLTAAAEGLTAPVRRLMLQIESTVSGGPGFDPLTTRRSFIVHASDYISEVVLTRLAIRLADEAPGIALEIVPPLSDPASCLENGSVDILITPEAYASANHPAELLYEEEHVLVGWSGNPALATAPSADTYFGMSHVAVQFPQSRAKPIAETEIARFGRARRVELIAPSFTSVPKFLVGTRRVSVMHRRLALIYARTLPLVIHPLPFTLPPLREVVQHHEVRTTDLSLAWLRARLHESAQLID
jgi:DNA-binding transcriptional LysR family regulator